MRRESGRRDGRPQADRPPTDVGSGLTSPHPGEHPGRSGRPTPSPDPSTLPRVARGLLPFGHPPGSGYDARMGEYRHEEDGDAALFLAEVGDSRPLADRTRIKAPRPEGRGRPDIAVPALAIDRTAQVGRADGVNDDVVSRLVDGRIRPEATLDLHGLTEAAAAPVLTRFLAEARAGRRTCVLVI